MPQELVVSKSYFEKWSHEVRVSHTAGSAGARDRGLFIERQQHRIFEALRHAGLRIHQSLRHPFATPIRMASTQICRFRPDNTIWLTDETRVDRDKAAFAQVTWDITSQWSLNGGLRYFTYDNTLRGLLRLLEELPALVGLKCFAPPSRRLRRART